MKNIFVYGTLMSGQSANEMLAGCKFLGKYKLADYALYHLEHCLFPGIKECRGESVVGEVYEIPEAKLPAFDRYEGEGDLYKRVTVTVAREGEEIEAFVYVYLSERVGRMESEEWNASESDYVWYACYGSNLDSERFSNYIEGGYYPITESSCPGCRDKSHWIDERMIEYPGCIYFAMNSGRWDGKGVAFFDPSEQKKTVMKLYKITRGQFHDVRRQEGAWYGRTVCLDVLSDNCPVYTLTSFHRLKDNMPCEKYYILIRNALMKNCNWCESEADNYLLDGVSP